MGKHKKSRDEAGLQARMTLYVTLVVIAVSAGIMILNASLFRKEIEKAIDDGISDAISSTTQIIEQMMLRVEDAANATALMLPSTLGNAAERDSILCGALSAMTNTHAVTIVLDRGFMKNVPGFYERIALAGKDGEIRLLERIGGDWIESDPIWQKSFLRGESGWSDPKVKSDGDVVCYSVPLNDRSGNRVGLLSVAVLESVLTPMVTRYKSRKDIDVSIFSANGEMVVAPDDYILKLAPEDMIVQERIIDHLGWKLVFSADRNIVDGTIREVLFALGILILFLFLTITAAITLTVRFVARPFVLEQEKTAREKAVMDKEMQLAANAQNELVPHVFPPFPQIGNLDLHACLYPARNVGGDLYDYFLQGDKLYFCIGDVSGKGVQAALFMAATHYLFRSAASTGNMSEAVQHMNRSLCADNGQCMFVTFWFGRLDLNSGQLEYVNAGHNEPAVIRDSRAEFMPKSENMPLGVWEEAEFVSGKVSLEPGDVLFLYTDGVTEAMDPAGHEFGTDKALEVLEGAGGSPASDIVSEVLGKVRAHADGAVQSDDITMLCLKLKSIQ